MIYTKPANNAYRSGWDLLFSGQKNARSPEEVPGEQGRQSVDQGVGNGDQAVDARAEGLGLVEPGAVAVEAAD